MNPASLAPARLYRLHSPERAAQGESNRFSVASSGGRSLSGEWQILEGPPAAELVDGADVEVLVISPALAGEPRWQHASERWLEAVGLHPVVSVRQNELQATYRANRMVLISPQPYSDSAVEAVVEFAYHEHELCEIESEIARGWATVEADVPLVYEINRAASRENQEIGQRVAHVLRLRIRHARSEPYLTGTPRRFSSTVIGLVEKLQEATHSAERAETADGQIEVQEYVYELASQRLGEHRHARAGVIIELIIVALLAAEVILLLVRRG